MNLQFHVYYNLTLVASCLFKRDAKRILKKRRKKAVHPERYLLKNSNGEIIS